MLLFRKATWTTNLAYTLFSHQIDPCNFQIPWNKVLAKKVTTECKSGFCKDFLCSFSVSLHKLSLEQNCYLIWQPCHYLKNCFMLVPWRFKGGPRCCGCKVSQVNSRTNYLVSPFHCTNYRCSITVPCLATMSLLEKLLHVDVMEI